MGEALREAADLGVDEGSVRQGQQKDREGCKGIPNSAGKQRIGKEWILQ